MNIRESLQELRDLVDDVQCELSLKESRSIRSEMNTIIDALTAAMPQPASNKGPEWTLLDRVEFALRDAGFDLDEAYQIASRATAAMPQVDGEAISDAAARLPPLPEARPMVPKRNGDYQLGYDAEDMRDYAVEAIAAAIPHLSALPPQGAAVNPVIARLFDPMRLPEPDGAGYVLHPDFDLVGSTDANECNIQNFFAAAGLDMEVVTSNEWPDVSHTWDINWFKPKTPEGWRLVSIHRSEGNVVAWFAKPSAAPQPAAPANDPSWPLLLRVEFALRDAGFPMDEAAEIAHKVAAAAQVAGSEDSQPQLSDAAKQAAALAYFTANFETNYPGPDTIISDPKWHAPRIFRAAQHAIKWAFGESAPASPPAALNEHAGNSERLAGVVDGYVRLGYRTMYGPDAFELRPIRPGMPIPENAMPIYYRRSEADRFRIAQPAPSAGEQA